MVMTCGSQPEVVHLLADQDQVVDVAGGIHPVGARGAHLRDRGGMVHGADGIALEGHHLEVPRLGRLLDLLRDREREQVVAREDRDALDVAVLLGHELGDAARTPCRSA